MGRQPADIRDILLSHLHRDHTGGAMELQDATGAELWMHPQDAEAIANGHAMRPVQPGPGPLNRLVVSAMQRNALQAVAPLTVQHSLTGGEVLHFARGLRVLHTPGHTRGHLAFLWPHDGGVLIAGDSCSNMLGRLSFSLLYEDLTEGQRTLTQMAGLPFDTAVFSHGRPLRKAARRFYAKWA